MMRPIKIFLFFFIIFILVGILSFLFPGNGIRLGERFTLHFFSIKSISTPLNSEYADISEIIHGDFDLFEDAIFEQYVKQVSDSVPTTDTLRVEADSLRKKVQPIEYPNQNHEILFPFFQQLNELKSSKNHIRVMHYGDSQIEGDRITSYIRHKLQSRFGGSGPGLLPIIQPYTQFSILQKTTDNWHRYTVFGSPENSASHGRYGAMGSFATFSLNTGDKVAKSTKSQEARITYSKSPYGFSGTKRYNQCRIFYSHNSSPFMIQLFNNNLSYDADIIPATNKLSELKWDFSSAPDNLTIAFQGNHSPEIYGIALDGPSGISVDNIPMRGSAGLIFSRMDDKLLKEMYNKLNVKLFIIQYGGNVTPHIGNNYAQYGKRLENQLKVLRKLRPEAPVIVVGIADMSRKEQERYVSYPYIENLRDAIREAAFSAGCAFWDLYEAMGGHNSMPAWVNADPPLASPDYVHFTARGARIIAEMFYNAFITEYHIYNNKMDVIAY